MKYGYYKSTIGIIEIKAEDGYIISTGFVETMKSEDESEEISRCKIQLEEYFQGKRKNFDIKIKYTVGTEFQRKVWDLSLIHISIGMQLTSDTGFTYTPVLLGILIPPIGIGLATIIDKLLVGRKVFDDGLGGSGLPSMILGVVGISEGAIPFMISDPLGQIPINVIGASIGASISFAMGSFAHIGCLLYTSRCV